QIDPAQAQYISLLIANSDVQGNALVNECPHLDWLLAQLPSSLKPRWKAAMSGANPAGIPPARTPITGIAGCCARAASGHAAAPPSSVMNSRRLMSDMGACFPRLAPMKRTQGNTERTAGPWATPEMF